MIILARGARTLGPLSRLLMCSPIIQPGGKTIGAITDFLMKNG
ncbi:hypothetical protein OHD41_27370 [Escherichia coli]|nr:hypothetical protein [Escherichia coli]